MTNEKTDRNPNGKPDEIALTSRTLFEIDYYAPTAALSPYVTTYYHFRCEEESIRDVQPAAIGHLSLFPYGTGEMQFANGHTDPANEVNLLTPLSRAAPFFVDGPFHAIGAALTPLGWASLTHLHAAEHGNRLYRASDWLGPEVETLGRGLCASYRSGETSGEACARALGDFIAANVTEPNSRHYELIRQTVRWLASSLNPDTDDLFAAIGYSQRQVERLVERYFGLPPHTLARKYRALRTAIMFSLPQLSPEYEAEIGEAFTDQSHMIREIRLFAGRTPARLSNDANAYLSELLSPKNLREILLPPES